MFVTACGTQALAEAERDPPRLALLDCDLPGRVSGFRVAETLRRFHDIPVMFYSAWQGEQYARAAELVGAVRWLAKTTPLEEVIAHVQDAVRQRAAVPEAQSVTCAPCRSRSAPLAWAAWALSSTMRMRWPERLASRPGVER